jgi:hypothetical protein
MVGEWLHWYYLIFLLPAATAVLVLLMTGLGGTHGGHSHGAHGGLHLHAHAGHGHAHGMGHGHATTAAHGHAHQAAGGHSHASHGAHHGHQHEPSAARQLLGFFGVGRAPVTIVVGSLMIGWGFCGTVALELLRPILRFPALFVGPSALIAAAGALLCAKVFGELAARVMPEDESYAISREGLMGLTGKVVYAVTEDGGRIHVFDQFRTLHVTPARVAPGAAPIQKGTEVIVASMDPERRFVVVEPLGFSMEKRTPAETAPSSATTAQSPTPKAQGLTPQAPGPIVEEPVVLELRNGEDARG